MSAGDQLLPASRRTLSGRLDSGVLYLSMFVMGACGLAYEYTLSKLAADLLGNSARQWAIVIGVMMFFMGVGADLQKHLRAHRLIEKLLAVEVALGLAGGFGPIALLYVYGHWPDAYFTLQYLWISGLGLLIGLEIPVLARINESYVSDLRVNLGGVLKMDYVGALCGALLWVFFLPRYFSLTEGAFVLGTFNLLAALITLAYFRASVVRAGAWSLGLGAVVVSLLFGLRQAEAWTVSAEQQLYRDRVIYSETTPFQHIVLTRSPAGDVALYINGHLQLHSFDEHVYHENLVHPALAIVPHPERVLILGGGDGMALREVLEDDRVENVVLVDIDPAMTRLAATQPDLVRLNRQSLRDHRAKVIENRAARPGGPLGLLQPNHRRRRRDLVDGPSIHVLNLDAVEFLEQAPGLFDLIVLDFPDPNALELSKLYSVEFYRMLAEKLTTDGLFVQQSTSPVHAREAFLCIGRTLRAAGLSPLPYHDNVPSFGEWGFWIGGRAERYSEERLRRLLEGIEVLRVPTRYLTPDTIRASLSFGKDQLRTSETAVNTMARDVIYQYYLEAWRRL